MYYLLRIMSYKYALSDNACKMTFYYHMKGDHIGSLNVSLCGPLHVNITLHGGLSLK